VLDPDSLRVSSTESALEPALSLFLRWRQFRYFGLKFRLRHGRTVELDRNPRIIDWSCRHWSTAVAHVRAAVLHWAVGVLVESSRMPVWSDSRVVGPITIHL